MWWNLEGLRGRETMDVFTIPAAVDYAAVFLFSITGALSATQRGHDVVGLVVLAFAAGLGGGFLRDGLILQDGPPAALRDGGFVLAVLAGCVVTWLFHARVERFSRAFLVLDAIGMAAYGIVGATKAAAAGLAPAACVLTGVVNAVGGGIIRDVLIREEPLLFRPGQFYAVAAAAGVSLFIFLDRVLSVPAGIAAGSGMLAALTIRLLSIYLNWTTRPVKPGRLP
jgi:uncharacterized membrane protein YeiH